MPTRRAVALFAALMLAGTGCRSTATSSASNAPRDLPEHSLSGLAAQHIVVLPTYSMRIAPGLAWARAIGRPADIQRTLDADILAALDERGVRKLWIFPEDLQGSYRRNPSYAAD